MGTENPTLFSLPRSSVASRDALASRVLSGRWSGQDYIPTQSVETRGGPDAPFGRPR
jgi:hypothetical protein